MRFNKENTPKKGTPVYANTGSGEYTGRFIRIEVSEAVGLRVLVMESDNPKFGDTELFIDEHKIVVFSTLKEPAYEAHAAINRVCRKLELEKGKAAEEGKLELALKNQGRMPGKVIQFNPGSPN